MENKPAGKKVVRYFLILSLLYILGCWLFWPSASFESSDGNWGDRELPLKDRDFDSMVYFFELYKIKCNAKDAILYRTTQTQYWNIFHWPSYWLENKWLVPYEESSKYIQGGIYPGVTKEHCFNSPQSDITVNEAIKRSKDYIKSLTGTSRVS